MADWPIYPNTSKIYCYNTNKQAPATPNTKSAYQELVASVPYTGQLVLLGNPSSNSTHLIDIAFGGAGSETIFLNNLYAATNLNAGTQFSPKILNTGLVVSAGQRLSFRHQCSVANIWLDFSAYIYPVGSFMVPGVYRCTTLGADTAASNGTEVDPGGTAGVKGNWVQFSASTPYDADGVLVAIGPNGNAGPQYAYWNIDLGLSSSPADRIIVGDFRIYSHIYQTIGPSYQYFPIKIPAGTEIHMRALCNINDATDRKFDAVLYLMG